MRRSRTGRGGRSRLHVVLLAGGEGTRFWPLSRRRRPKHLLALDHGRTPLRSAWERAAVLAPRERRWVVVSRELAPAVRRELPELLAANTIVEPSRRDTGPAIALACAAIAARDPAAIAVVTPTDHVIRDRAAFVRAVREGRAAAAEGALVCLGVRPTRPATALGYLRVAGALGRSGSARVTAFVEKPNAARARRFARDGAHLWNSGIFIWRCRAFLDEAREVAPRLHAAAIATAAGAAAAWLRAPRTSVDRAVMEKARHVRVVRLDAGWDDLGSWDAAVRIREASGRTVRSWIAVDSPGSAVFGGRRLVALVGVPDVVVVDTEDALLVVARRDSEKLKRAVAAAAALGREDVL